MKQVADTYNQNPEHEWTRLARSPYQKLEFQITWHHLMQHLLRGGLILDAGGGPGRYTRELCRAGYDVILLDLAQGNIEFARQQLLAEPEAVQKHLVEAQVGDIRRLELFPDHTFDAVLCLGAPLSHIPDAVERQTALGELVRVTRPGGLTAVSVTGWLAVLRTILMEFSYEMLEPHWQDLILRGDEPGPTRTTWHWYRAAELRQLAEASGLETLVMAGCQGLSTSLIEATNRLAEEPDKWEVWYQLLLDTSTDPAVVDMAEHILYIGRKPVEGDGYGYPPRNFEQAGA